MNRWDNEKAVIFSYEPLKWPLHQRTSAKSLRSLSMRRASASSKLPLVSAGSRDLSNRSSKASLKPCIKNSEEFIDLVVRRNAEGVNEGTAKVEGEAARAGDTTEGF